MEPVLSETQHQLYISPVREVVTVYIHAAFTILKSVVPIQISYMSCVYTRVHCVYIAT